MDCWIDSHLIEFRNKTTKHAAGFCWWAGLNLYKLKERLLSGPKLYSLCYCVSKTTSHELLRETWIMHTVSVSGFRSLYKAQIQFIYNWIAWFFILCFSLQERKDIWHVAMVIILLVRDRLLECLKNKVTKNIILGHLASKELSLSCIQFPN